MKDRDDELEALLAPLADVEATPLERARWRRALAARERSAWNPRSLAWGAVAGLVVGIVSTWIALNLGSAPAENFADSATIVHVYAKAD